MTMVSGAAKNRRVVSGMRVTGRLHLGNYHGALKNWIKLQHEYDCFFFAADWHGLTTHYENTGNFDENSWAMITDWLAAGLNPNSCKIFLQSGVPEHAELHLLLSMVTPLSWLERVPTYKDQIEKLKGKDLATYGFLGYPLLQSADVLVYKADYVPVGEDQLAHIEISREIARRFNHIFGKEPDFEDRAEQAIKKMGKKAAKLFKTCLKSYREQGDTEALEKGRELVNNQNNISIGEQERLYGYLEGSGKIILPEPEALLSECTKMPGTDGQKMSKSYNNTIGITEDLKSVETKIRVMQTDPARVRKTDPGTPEKCPVWGLHEVYSDDEVKKWVQQGCTTAGIGCLDCKGPLIDSIKAELQPIHEAAEEYQNNPSLVKSIVQQGTLQAREVAKSTMHDVREAIGLADL